MRPKLSKLKAKYQLNKNTNVGGTCVCPSCQTNFIKTNYQQAFCKSKQGTECKDFYWNNVTPTKRNNTTRISPASAAFLAINDTPIVWGYGDSQREIDREDRLYNELHSDGGEATVERCKWCECIRCRCED